MISQQDRTKWNAHIKGEAAIKDQFEYRRLRALAKSVGHELTPIPDPVVQPSGPTRQQLEQARTTVASELFAAKIDRDRAAEDARARGEVNFWLTRITDLEGDIERGDVQTYGGMQGAQRRLASAKRESQKWEENRAVQVAEQSRQAAIESEIPRFQRLFEIASSRAQSDPSIAQEVLTTIERIKQGMLDNPNAVYLALAQRISYRQQSETMALDSAAAEAMAKASHSAADAIEVARELGIPAGDVHVGSTPETVTARIMDSDGTFRTGRVDALTLQPVE